jgi:hypothetical protein
LTWIITITPNAPKDLLISGAFVLLVEWRMMMVMM